MCQLFMFAAFHVAFFAVGALGSGWRWTQTFFFFFQQVSCCGGAHSQLPAQCILAMKDWKRILCELLWQRQNKHLCTTYCTCWWPEEWIFAPFVWEYNMWTSKIKRRICTHFVQGRILPAILWNVTMHWRRTNTCVYLSHMLFRLVLW